MRLYHYWRSSSSYRVRWALNLKRVSVEYIAVNLLTDESDSPEHLRRNPMGYVPALELEDGRVLGESIAIMEWLEETTGGPPLLPGDDFQRARIRQLAEIVNSGTQPLHNLSVVVAHSEDEAERKRWMQMWIRKGLAAYETLAHETAGKFSVGDTPTIADMCLIPLCYAADRNEVPLAEFPTIARINATALATPECQAAHPDRFKPA